MSGYEQTIDLGLTALLTTRRAQGLPLPATVRRESPREALIVIGSDRGLCGRYNEIVAREAEGHLSDRTAVLCVIGARAAARLEASGHDVDRLFLQPGSVGGLRPLVQSVTVQIEHWTRRSRRGPCPRDPQPPRGADPARCRSRGTSCRSRMRI